jgi:hypothetical protein
MTVVHGYSLLVVSACQEKLYINDPILSRDYLQKIVHFIYRTISDSLYFILFNMIRWWTFLKALREGREFRVRVVSDLAEIRRALLSGARWSQVPRGINSWQARRLQLAPVTSTGLVWGTVRWKSRNNGIQGPAHWPPSWARVRKAWSYSRTPPIRPSNKSDSSTLAGPCGRVLRGYSYNIPFEALRIVLFPY